MNSVTQALYEAYVGEAKAVLRLGLFAQRAEKDGYPQIAKLFRAIEASERIHGERCLRILREIKDTETNLSDAFEAETKIAGVAYDKMIQLAVEEGNSAAEKHFSQSRDVEAQHAKLYKEAMEHLMEEEETTYYICDVCGYVSDGVLPDECPVCGVGKERFRSFE